jgi:inosine-uridine nucleoside N-ribohydrolase
MLVHLDTDLGGDTDDACALAMLLRWPGAEIAGITTCTEIEGRRAGMVRYILRLANKADIPVAAGAEGKSGPAPWPLRPGLSPEAEFWPEPIEPVRSRPGEALDLLDQSVQRGATVIAIGPLTNLAAFEAMRPGRLATVPAFICGGYLHPPREGYPQWAPEMDYNIQQDPEASHLVLSRCAPALIPLSVTAEVFVRDTDVPRLQAEGPLGRLLARQCLAQAAAEKKREYGRQFARLPDDLLNFHYDPLTCAAALGWNGIEIGKLPIKLEMRDGCLYQRVDPSGTPMSVATAVDGERFNRLWLDVVTAAGRGSFTNQLARQPG